MEWRDEAIVIGVRRHGESSALLEVMTRAHGRHLGLVRGGRSTRSQPVLQAGNVLEIVWRARLDEHLGTFAVEGVDLRAARLMASPLALYGLASAGALIRLLPERDPHPALYETLEVLIDHLDEPGIAPAVLIRFELAILSELGFGVDLTQCAVTGQSEGLAYVSPKSARAVSREAGAPYADKLLPLPSFLVRRSNHEPTPDELRDGFRLTSYFLDRHVFEPRGITPPDERARFVMLALRG